MRLETLSCEKTVGGKSDSQYRSSISSNCNSESRPEATESVYCSAKDVDQLDEVTAEKKIIEKINTYKSPLSFGKLESKSKLKEVMIVILICNK